MVEKTVVAKAAEKAAEKTVAAKVALWLMLAGVLSPVRGSKTSKK